MITRKRAHELVYDTLMRAIIGSRTITEAPWFRLHKFPTHKHKHLSIPTVVPEHHPCVKRKRFSSNLLFLFQAEARVLYCSAATFN